MAHVRRVLLATLLGGIGMMLGPIVGGSVMISLDNYLATAGLPSHVVLGAIFMVAVLLFRRGIVGARLPRWRKSLGPSFQIDQSDKIES